MPDETIYYDLDHSGAEIDSAVAFVEANEYKDGTVTFDADTPAAADNLVSGSRFGKIFADLRKWYSTFLRKDTGGILGTNASIYSLGGANARIMFPKIQIGTGPSDAGVDVERVDRKVSTMPAAPTNDQYPSALLLKSTLAGYVPTTRKVNGNALSADVVIEADDVNALPAAYDGEEAYEVDVRVDFIQKIRASMSPVTSTDIVNKEYADTKVALVDLGTDQDNCWGDSPLLDQATEIGVLYTMADTDGFKPVIFATRGLTSSINQYAFDGETNYIYSRIGIVNADSTITWGEWVRTLTMSDLATKQNVSNLVTAISPTSTDTQYPSAKCVYDAINSAITGAIEGAY